MIEDTDKPRNEFEEIAASGEIAKELLGKKVGDTFVLAKSPIKNRVGKITQILSKYTRRFQAIGDRMELKSRTRPSSGQCTFRRPTRSRSPTSSPCSTPLRRTRRCTQNSETYTGRRLHAHMFGEKLGHGACEALFDLATSEMISCDARMPRIGSCDGEPRREEHRGS